MKKEVYCKQCNLNFEYTINNSYDLKVTSCPQCHRMITINQDKKNPEITPNKELGKTGRRIFNFWYYFHLICSIISIIFFFTNLDILLVISTSINLIVFFIERLIGLNRNWFGIIGIIIASIICSLLLDNIILGICLGISIIFIASSIIQFIIDFIFSCLFRKFN